ncbi:hypothetical protein LTR17_022301 [Elasticomyces elasticus]|nr:hypothetical protein LTR17_022301 [Elasticomyces elasticus]
MSDRSLPVPKYDSEPLIDKEGIYGYRMQKLHPLDFEKTGQYLSQVAAVLDKVHAMQFSIGDLHPGNVMLNDNGDIILIDLSYAGRLDHAIPPHIPEHVYGEALIFNCDADQQRLMTYFCEQVAFPHFAE